MTSRYAGIKLSVSICINGLINTTPVSIDRVITPLIRTFVEK